MSNKKKYFFLPDIVVCRCKMVYNRQKHKHIIYYSLRFMDLFKEPIEHLRLTNEEKKNCFQQQENVLYKKGYKRLIKQLNPSERKKNTK